MFFLSSIDTVNVVLSILIARNCFRNVVSVRKGKTQDAILSWFVGRGRYSAQLAGRHFSAPGFSFSTASSSSLSFAQAMNTSLMSLLEAPNMRRL